MFTTPSPDDMIEGVIAALQNEILPFVTNPKAQAAVLISQAILQMARQSMAAHDAQILDEHNSMAALLRDVAAAIGETTGPAADAIRTAPGRSTIAASRCTWSCASPASSGDCVVARPTPRSARP